jgi:ATP-dependent DNA helicase RecG
LLVQRDSFAPRELVDALELSGPDALGPWLKRLLDWQIIRTTGRTKATQYLVDARLMLSLKFPSEISIKKIEPQRLLSLVLEDLKQHPLSAISEVHQRIGKATHAKQIKRVLDQLVGQGAVRFEGEKRWRRYFVTR